MIPGGGQPGEIVQGGAREISGNLFRGGGIWNAPRRIFQGVDQACLGVLANTSYSIVQGGWM